MSTTSIEEDNNIENILQSIRNQINHWGKDANWKIDLVLLDNEQQKIQYTNETNKTYLPITSKIHYPWDYVVPNKEYSNEQDELQLKLRDSLERQKYLHNIVWSQAEQIKHSTLTNTNENAINTMKNIYLMSQNEQKMHYILETSLLKKDIEILNKKLKKMQNMIEKIETMEIKNERLDTTDLIQDREILLRKLHLAELRLSARDSEIEYLSHIIDTLKTSEPTKNKSYLFQQQFSPLPSDIRSSEPSYPLSALDSLGILADQMLSDPEFDTNIKPQKRIRSRLNDRSIQSPNPTIYTLSQKDDQNSTGSSSPEPMTIPKKPRSTYTRWTSEEDQLLRKAVKKYGHSNWEACSKDIQGRSNIQCRNRWIRHLEHKPKTNSIAALLNHDYLPTYRPPSPIATPIKRPDSFHPYHHQ